MGLMPFPIVLLVSLFVAGGSLALGYKRSPNLGLALVLLILVLHGLLYLGATVDDAFISFRYSANLADGQGIVWNPGERVEGYTNFLWVLLLAAPASFGISLVISSQVLGFTFSAALLLVIRQLAGVWDARLTGQQRRLVTLTTSLALVLSAPFAFWTFAGLETTLFAFLVTAGAMLHLREESEGYHFYWSGPVFFLAALTRPEGLLFFGITWIFKALGLIRLKGDRDTLLTFLVWSAMFFVLFGVYFLWRYQYYGYLLPNTFYAKVPLGFLQFERGLAYLTSFATLYVGFLVLVLPLAAFFSSDKRQPLYLMSLLASWIVYVLYIGGDTLAQFRLLVPIMPIFYFLLMISAVQAFEVLRAARPKDSLMPAMGLAVLAIAAAGILYPSQAAWDTHWERESTAEHSAIGRWLRDNAPEDYTIAVFPAGAIPYYSQLPAIDMFGLNDEYIAHKSVSGFGSGGAGHEKYDGAYVFSRRPEIILPHAAYNVRDWTRTDYEALLPILHLRAVTDMMSDELFWDVYSEMSVQLEPGLWFNFFLRRDAPIPSLER